jgi:SCY1-like protein 2
LNICEVLNVEQFHRFMEVIRKLGERVEKEHDQFLRDSQRLEDRSANKANGGAAKSFAGSVDFETLVGTTGVAGKNLESADDSGNWEDDVWGSIFANGEGVSPVSTSVPVRIDKSTFPRL